MKPRIFRIPGFSQRQLWACGWGGSQQCPPSPLGLGSTPLEAQRNWEHVAARTPLSYQTWPGESAKAQQKWRA